MRDPKNFLIVGLVAVSAFFAGGSLWRGQALGQGYPGGSVDSNGRMIAVTGTIGSGVSVLWVIDTLDHQIAIYHSKGGKTIELIAARNIEWDLKIEYLNDESRYHPEQLKRLFLQDGRGSGIRDPGESTREPGSGGAPGNGQEDD